MSDMIQAIVDQYVHDKGLPDADTPRDLYQVILDDDEGGQPVVWDLYFTGEGAFRDAITACLKEYALGDYDTDDSPEDVQWGSALEKIMGFGTFASLLAKHGLEQPAGSLIKGDVCLPWQKYVLGDDDLDALDDDDTFECGKCEQTCTGERHSSYAGDICDECFNEDDNEERLIL